MPVSFRLSDDPMLDLDQVAVLLEVEPRTVARWAEAGRLDPMDTPTGGRRFAQSDVLRLMVEIKHTQKSSAARPVGPLLEEAGPRGHAVAVAEAALDVTLTAGAVATAAALASDAASRARHGRAVAGREAELRAAEEASQNAAATRFRADAAASRVRDAADLAASSERSSTAEGDPVAVQRAVRMAATVEAAAAVELRAMAAAHLTAADVDVRLCRPGAAQ